MRYKTVFLDFDDTLIDTQGYASKCLKDLFSEYKLNLFFKDFASFLAHYHKHVHELWNDYALGKMDKQTLITERFQRPLGHIEDLSSSQINNINKEFTKRVVLIDKDIPGGLKLVKYLKNKGYKLVMLSNGFSEMQYDKIKNSGFDNLFDKIILSDVVGYNKPHPNIFKESLRISKSSPEETIMIGDNYIADIKGAMQSNIDQIWYNPKNESAEEPPTYMVKSLSEIINIL